MLYVYFIRGKRATTKEEGSNIPENELDRTLCSRVRSLASVDESLMAFGDYMVIVLAYVDSIGQWQFEVDIAYLRLTLQPDETAATGQLQRYAVKHQGVRGVDRTKMPAC